MIFGCSGEIFIHRFPTYCMTNKLWVANKCKLKKLFIFTFCTNLSPAIEILWIWTPLRLTAWNLLILFAPRITAELLCLEKRRGKSFGRLAKQQLNLNYDLVVVLNFSIWNPSTPNILCANLYPATYRICFRNERRAQESDYPKPSFSLKFFHWIGLDGSC